MNVVNIFSIRITDNITAYRFCKQAKRSSYYLQFMEMEDVLVIHSLQCYLFYYFTTCNECWYTVWTKKIIHYVWRLTSSAYIFKMPYQFPWFLVNFNIVVFWTYPFISRSLSSLSQHSIIDLNVNHVVYLFHSVMSGIQSFDTGILTWSTPPNSLVFHVSR